jgi:tagatose-6-phosphate ketose/aldose isomerase
VVQHLLEQEPGIDHLVISCNANGRLAKLWGSDGADRARGVHVLVLDERTCDRSLVMTSSFTSMAVAGLSLACRSAADQDRYVSEVDMLAASVSGLFANLLGRLETFSLENVDRMIAVGSGALHGAALEVSLKMLEMTDGRVMTRAERCLGLRHGPMCALHKRSLLFLPLSSHTLRRAYQVDLLKDLHRKRLGGWKLIVGSDIPTEALAVDDLALEMAELRGLGDEWIALASVVAGQLLAFLRCRAEGLRPDEPAISDSITRVVRGFTLHNV